MCISETVAREKPSICVDSLSIARLYAVIVHGLTRTSERHFAAPLD